MAFGLSKGGGNFLPYVKYDAKAGAFFNKDGQEIEDFAAIMDFANVEVGWIKYGSSGVAPDFRMVPFGEDIGAAPSDEHKQGIRLNMLLSKDTAEYVEGGPLVTFSTTAFATLEPLGVLHDEFIANEDDKLPIVRFAGRTAVKSKNGTNYTPKLEVEDWVDRKPVDEALAANEAGEESGAAETKEARPGRAAAKKKATAF